MEGAHWGALCLGGELMHQQVPWVGSRPPAGASCLAPGDLVQLQNWVVRHGVPPESQDLALRREALGLGAGKPGARLGVLGWHRGLTGAVVDVEEATLGAQQLVGRHGVDVQVCVQGQDGPVEHREGGPWARGRGVTAGPTWPPPAPSRTPAPVSHG